MTKLAVILSAAVLLVGCDTQEEQDKKIAAIYESTAKDMAVQDGDMGLVEAMLYGQVMTLQTIFTSLARRAAANDGLKQFQVNLTLGPKAQAQAQCRATLEALAEIKNPRPVAFVKQANISRGHQQVNNGVQPAQQAGPARGGGVESLPAPGQETV